MAAAKKSTKPAPAVKKSATSAKKSPGRGAAPATSRAGEVVDVDGGAEADHRRRRRPPAKAPAKATAAKKAAPRAARRPAGGRRSNRPRPTAGRGRPTTRSGPARSRRRAAPPRTASPTPRTSTPSSSRRRRTPCSTSGPSSSARPMRLEDEANSLIEDGEMGDVQFDDESGEGDTMVVERERDLALSAQARQTVADIDDALARIADGTYGYSMRLGPADPARAPGGDPVGDRAGRGEGRRDRPSMTTCRSARCADRWRSPRSRRRSSTNSPSTGRSTRSATATMVHVVGSLQLNLAFNSGMAFSRGRRARPVRPGARRRRDRRPAHRPRPLGQPVVRGGASGW